jgi:DNA polymerase-1
LVERYQKLLKALLGLPLADEKKRKPHVLGLSEPAKRLWVDFYNEWGGVQMAAEGEQRAAFAKIEAYASRLALLHHVIAHVAAGVSDLCPITETSIRAGIELARWCADEAARIYGMLRETDEERQVRCLVEWIAAHGGRVTVRDLQRANARRWPTHDLAEGALQGLVDAGFGRWEEGPPPRGGGHRWRCFVLGHPTPDKSDTRWEDGDGPDDGPSDTRPKPPPDRPDEFNPNHSDNGTCGEGSEGRDERVSDLSGVGHQGGDNLQGEAPERVSGAPSYRLIQDAADLAAVAAALDETALVGLDVETTGLSPRTDRVRLLSLTTDTVDGSTFTYVIDLAAVDPTPLWEPLANKPLVIHNAVFDLGFLGRLGFAPTGPVHDTLLLAKLLVAGTFADCDLAAMVKRELGHDLDKTAQKSDWSGALRPEQIKYAADDAAVLVPLLEKLTAKIQTAKLEQAAQIEQRCLPGLVWLANKGVAFDRQRWEALAANAKVEAERLRSELGVIAPKCPDCLDFATWNWDSPVQVKEALAAAGIVLENTDDDALAGIDHPLAALLRQYRDAQKRNTTYGKDWLKHVAADGRVYSHWKQYGAKTGRMASGDPNMQNVPRDPAYRQCFRPSAGRVLVKADYSQIELRIAAKVANETRMIDAYRRGDDLHTLTAQRMTGRAEVTKRDRQLAKPVNFGLIYGLGVSSLCRKAKTDYGLDLSEEDAQRYRDAFFAAYPGIGAWHRLLKRQRATETRTLTGRRVLVEADLWFGARANFTVQGSGGDGIKQALALLWERRDQCPGAFPVLVVHDEIVIECDADQADAVAAWLKQAMVEAMAPLISPVPVEVEVTVARSWGGD